MIVRDNDTASFDIRLRGLAPDLVITAWISYFFPPGIGPHPIFAPVTNPDDPTEVSPAVAAVSAPLASTNARFSDGLAVDANEVVLTRQGTKVAGRLKVRLNYNPLKSGQGPLRNGLSDVSQALAPPGSGAEQPTCCPEGFPTPELARHQAIGSSYLRVFDPTTGFQILGEDGWPRLLRSPVPVAFIALVIHTDRTTHGINPGLPIFPIPGVSARTGDHYLVGIFDLRDFHMD